MALSVSRKFVWPNVTDVPLVHIAGRDHPSLNQFTQPCRRERINLVVITPGHRPYRWTLTPAAACGVPQIAGQSGGAADAVVDGQTGLIIGNPDLVDDVVAGLRQLLNDENRRKKMGEASRLRAENLFDYDKLALTLGKALKVH
jgi:phosphatidylinositol alpha-1,6-mannosyltransferase